MARTLQVHPLSLVLGFAFAAICTVTMSQIAVQPGQVNQFTPPCTMQVEYGPHARDMVQLRANTPFLVPRGRLLVLTALGTPTFATSQAIVSVDGVHMLEHRRPATDSLSMSAVPGGFAVRAGSTVLILDGSNDTNAIAWGYLTTE